MLLLETERFILETTFALNPYPVDAPIMTLEQCLPYLKLMIENDKAVYTMRRDTAQLRISDFSYSDYEEEGKGKGAITLLLQYTDSRASNPSFGHMETGLTRTVVKEDGEGLSVTAHFTIEINPINEAMPTVHNAVLEEVGGITKTVINSALTSMLRECTNFEFRDENTGRTKKCRPQVKIDTNAGQKLEDIMKKGKISGFSAVKYKAENKMDEEGELEIQQEAIIIKSPRKRGQPAIDLIKKVAKLTNAQNYSRLMVRYQDANNKQKSLNISTREEDFADGLFGKSERIILGDNIQQCEPEIHEELRGKMVNYLMKM
ncbi:hypothetical protein AB4161_05695 [Vibrio sp. 10N.286.51.E5]|uniref:hypothetical protein n=1 Tax=Vibrio sp. 10N.286.51.E5 TaxID=3229709 RepID=UPI00355443E6